MEHTRASKICRTALWAAIGFVIALPSGADTDLGGWKLSGTAELGGRTVTGDDWGSAKYEEYREQRPGVFGEGNFLLGDPTEKYYLRSWLRDVGERDEHYSLEAGRWGRYRLELEYGELPHVYSNQAASRYRPGTDEQLRFGPSRSVPLEFRLRTGAGRLLYRPDPEEWGNWELSATYDIQDRQGTKPYAINFGFSGGPAVNVARPIDERIHEVNLAARWGQELWNFELGYTGSFFQNDVKRLEIGTDTTDPAASRDGQISLAPNNAAHTFRLAAGTSLPLGFPARLAGTFAYSERRQDEDFQCHTITAAIDPRPGLIGDRCPYVGGANLLDLPDSSLEGEVDVFLANLVLTARPHRRLNLTARYRLYDYDNDTPELIFPNHVSYDTTLATDPLRSVPNEYRRQNASLDASYRLLDDLTFRTRYAWEQWARSRDRSVTRLDEHGARFALDYRPDPTFQLRTSYEFAVRRGNEYEPFARLDEYHLSPLTDGEKAAEVFPLMRKYDQADRISDRFDLQAVVAPREDLSLTFTGSYSQADYDNTDYGLRDDERYSLGGDISYRPVSWLGLSSWYTFEDIKYRQKSRTRSLTSPPPPRLPVEGFDWTTLSKDQVHNLGFRADVQLVPDRLDLELGYNLQHAIGKTRSSGVAAGASNFPGLEDVLQSVDAVLVYQLREDLSIKTGYRWEKFDLKNFRIDDLLPGGDQVIFLGERIDDYTAHVVEFSLIYSF